VTGLRRRREAAFLSEPLKGVQGVPMNRSFVRLSVAALALALAPSAWAADPASRTRSVVVSEEYWEPAPAWLVPDCEEKLTAVVLHCAPRETVWERDSLAIAQQRRIIQPVGRRPYPQLFSWSYP
jgi:hypothetical protein